MQAKNSGNNKLVLSSDFDENKIHVFYDSIDPSDIKKSCINNLLNVDYFLSALSILA